MADKNPNVTKNADSPETLTDDQIVTERKVERRSFLSTTGALLAGAAGIVSTARASQNDPDQRKPTDPDKKKAADPDQKKSSDPDKKKAADPDKKKSTDPDKKQTDPDSSHR